MIIELKCLSVSMTYEFVSFFRTWAENGLNKEAVISDGVESNQTIFCNGSKFRFQVRFSMVTVCSCLTTGQNKEQSCDERSPGAKDKGRSKKTTVCS